MSRGFAAECPFLGPPFMTGTLKTRLRNQARPHKRRAIVPMINGSGELSSGPIFSCRVNGDRA